MTLFRLDGRSTLIVSIVFALALTWSEDVQSQVKPSSAEDYLKRGNELRSKRDWDAAIAEYREAVRLNSTNADAHRLLGAMLREKGDFDGALAEERAAVHLKPESDCTHEQLGIALGDKGDSDSFLLFGLKQGFQRGNRVSFW